MKNTMKCIKKHFNESFKSEYKINCCPGCVMFIHVACLWMCVLFYFDFVYLRVRAFAFKFKVLCGSAFEPGASGLPYYYTPPVCVPDVIGGLAVCRHNNNKNKNKDPVGSLRTTILLRTTCTRSCCTWRASCVAALQEPTNL